MTPVIALSDAPISPSRDLWTVRIAAALAVVFFVTVCLPVLPYARQHDFIPFYVAAQMMREGRISQVYDPAAQLAAQRALVPDLAVMTPYVRPPVYAVLLAPYPLVSLGVAFAGFLVLQIAVLALIWRWAYRRFGPQSLIFCSLFVPTAFGVANAQDCVLMLAVVLGSFLALEKGRDAASGALLAVGLIKFHLLLLMAPAMVVRRKWRMLAAYGAVAVLEAVASIALIGPKGIRQFAALLTSGDIATISPSPERMMNVHAILSNLWIDGRWSGAAAVCTVIAIAFIGVRAARSEWLWFWIAAIGSLMVAPHVYEYDAALLLPALLISISVTGGEPDMRRLRLAGATVALPIVYLCTLLGRPWAIAPSAALAVWFALLVRYSAVPRRVASALWHNGSVGQS